MTVIWLICYLFSHCPDFVHNEVHFAWAITLVICLIMDIFS